MTQTKNNLDKLMALDGSSLNNVYSSGETVLIAVENPNSSRNRELNQQMINFKRMLGRAGVTDHTKDAQIEKDKQFETGVEPNFVLSDSKNQVINLGLGPGGATLNRIFQLKDKGLSNLNLITTHVGFRAYLKQYIASKKYGNATRSSNLTRLQAEDHKIRLYTAVNQLLKFEGSRDTSDTNRDFTIPLSKNPTNPFYAKGTYIIKPTTKIPGPENSTYPRMMENMQKEFVDTIHLNTIMKLLFMVLNASKEVPHSTTAFDNNSHRWNQIRKHLVDPSDINFLRNLEETKSNNTMESTTIYVPTGSELDIVKLTQLLSLIRVPIVLQTINNTNNIIFNSFDFSECNQLKNITFITRDVPTMTTLINQVDWVWLNDKEEVIRIYNILKQNIPTRFSCYHSDHYINRLSEIYDNYEKRLITNPRMPIMRLPSYINVFQLVEPQQQGLYDYESSVGYYLELSITTKVKQISVNQHVADFITSCNINDMMIKSPNQGNLNKNIINNNSMIFSSNWSQDTLFCGITGSTHTIFGFLSGINFTKIAIDSSNYKPFIGSNYMNSKAKIKIERTIIGFYGNNSSIFNNVANFIADTSSIRMNLNTSSIVTGNKSDLSIIFNLNETTYSGTSNYKGTSYNIIDENYIIPIEAGKDSYNLNLIDTEMIDSKYVDYTLNVEHVGCEIYDFEMKKLINTQRGAVSDSTRITDSTSTPYYSSSSYSSLKEKRVNVLYRMKQYLVSHPYYTQLVTNLNSLSLDSAIMERITEFRLQPPKGKSKQWTLFLWVSNLQASDPTDIVSVLEEGVQDLTIEFRDASELGQKFGGPEMDDETDDELNNTAEFNEYHSKNHENKVNIEIINDIDEQTINVTSSSEGTSQEKNFGLKIKDISLNDFKKKTLFNKCIRPKDALEWLVPLQWMYSDFGSKIFVVKEGQCFVETFKYLITMKYKHNYKALKAKLDKLESMLLQQKIKYNQNLIYELSTEFNLKFMLIFMNKENIYPYMNIVGNGVPTEVVVIDEHYKHITPVRIDAYKYYYVLRNNIGIIQTLQNYNVCGMEKYMFISKKRKFETYNSIMYKGIHLRSKLIYLNEFRRG